MHKAPKCIQSLWDHPKKFLLCKSTKKARYVRSLGKKPHFGAFQRLKKVFLSAQSVCARLRNGPIIMQIPRGYQKKQFIVQKVCDFVDKVEKTPFWGLPSGPKKLKKLTGALRCMHKAPKCIQSLWDHPKKFLLCKSTKKARYVRSLGKKPHFGAFPEAQKGVLICPISLRKAAHWPNNNANPSGLSEKNSLLCRKSAILSIRWKKTPFWGLPSGPKKLKKLTGALRCMHKAPKCIQSLWDHPKKIPFVQKYKESAICAILREKNPFWGIPRGSKRCSYLRNLSAQGCALAQ